MSRAVLIAAAVAAVWSGLAASAAAAPPRVILQDDGTLLHRGDEVRERSLDEIRALGADAIRVLVVWRNHAPATARRRRPLGFDAGDANAYPAGTFANLDALLAAATARGLHLIVTPTGPGPAWASGCRRGSLAARQACAPQPDDFRRFVTALGRRYPEQRHWAVWNEPNNPNWLIPQFAAGRPASPRHYRRLVTAAARGLRASGHAGDELLAGETAPIGAQRTRTRFSPLMPGRFLRGLLCRRCGRLSGVTGLSHHAYTRGGSRGPRFASLPDELAIADLGALTRLVRTAVARGQLPARAGVHLTEGGWQTSPPDRIFGVPLGAQARFLNEMEWMARAHPRVRSIAQYLLYDEGRTARFQSGLRFDDGRAKPALRAFGLPVWVVRRGSRVTVWGRPRRASDATRVEVQRRLPGSRVWRTMTTVPRGPEVLVTLRSAPGRWRLRLGTATSRAAAEARR